MIDPSLQVLNPYLVGAIVAVIVAVLRTSLFVVVALVAVFARSTALSRRAIRVLRVIRPRRRFPSARGRK
jgi:hypothetical protein